MADWLATLDSNQTFKRAVNRGMILDALRQGPTSRLGLHKQFGIRLSTVGELIEEMLAAELLIETGAAKKAAGERGRPEQQLALNLDGPFALGISIDREHLHLGRVNLAGQLLTSHTVAVESNDKSFQLVAQIAREIHHVLPGGEDPLADCLGVGVALPGILDVKHGRVMLSSAFPGIEKSAPLAERVAKAVGVRKAVLGNVANAYLSAERLYGAARGCRDAVLVLLEAGQIGAAVLADGRLVRGQFESSAELGHFKIEADGPSCNCGGKGCLETFIGWPYLHRKLVDRGRRDLAEAGAAAFWTSTHSTCKELRSEALRRLGRALGSLINLCRPAVVILSGSLAQHQTTVVDPLTQAMRKDSLPPFAAQLEVKTSTLGADAGILGGAALVLQQVFAVPEVTAA